MRVFLCQIGIAAPKYAKLRKKTLQNPTKLRQLLTIINKKVAILAKLTFFNRYVIDFKQF